MSNINPWLEERLGSEGEELTESGPNTPGRVLPLIVECDPSDIEVVQETLSPVVEQMDDFIAIPDTPLAFIPFIATEDMVRDIANIEGVRQLHYNMPVQIYADLPKISQLQPPRIKDALLGEVGINPISQQAMSLLSIAPKMYSQLGLPPGPLLDANMFLANNPAPLPPIHSPKVDEVVPTSVVKEKVGIPDDNEVEDTKVGVLDTGAIDVNHPQWRKEANVRSTTGEPAADMQGHGSWCTTCAYGGIAETNFGRVEGMSDVAGENIHLCKVLTNIGFGMTDMILRGMEWMVENDVEVVNMSLGGELQGSVKDDPQVKVIQETSDSVNWVIAAGNSGPDEWTVGSPGAAPDALTVAAFSTLNDDVANFSSRGPQGAFYKDHPEILKRDKEEFGEDLFKPDIGGYGGGPSGDNPRDDLLSGSQGSSDSPPDGYAAMRGTSMASPQVAGLVALALEKGLIKSIDDIKNLFDGEKDVAGGYGLLEWEDLK